MKRILITGSNGRFGKVLSEGLRDNYEIVPFELPEQDATNYTQLISYLGGCAAVIHMAFDLKHENSKTGTSGNPDNLVMGNNVLAAAAKLGVANCIMGSSVNAVRTQGYNNQSYRATKLMLETTADALSELYPDTHFTSVRLGSILEDQPPQAPLSPTKSWISHRDVVGLTGAILEAPHQSGHERIFGVSDRPDQPYNPANPYGWAPQDSFGYPSQY